MGFGATCNYLFIKRLLLLDMALNGNGSWQGSHDEQTAVPEEANNTAAAAAVDDADGGEGAGEGGLGPERREGGVSRRAVAVAVTCLAVSSWIALSWMAAVSTESKLSRA